MAICLQRWAQRSLGTCFTLTLQSDEHQPICRQGPYRWLRHPAYLAQILLWIGLGITSGSLAAAALIGAIATLGYVYRIHEEERVLTDALGNRYSVYAKETRRLIPLVW